MFYTLACGLLALAGPAKALLRADAEAQVASARDQPHSSFSQWSQLHGKVYETEEEYARRYAIWLDNLNYIESYNSRQTTHWLGLSPHADLTSEEFQSQWLGFDYEKAKNQPRNEVSLGADNGELPDAVDWVSKGAVTKVKNQKSCGSCWAFSTTGAIEGVNEIYTGDLVSLSEQELVDCDVAVDHGCNGGLMDHAFDWVIENGGIDTEKDYKYNAKQGQCNVARENRHVVTIDSYRDVPSGKPAELQAAVAKQPVAIAVQANQRSFQLYGGGVLSEGCGEDLDHGVLLVGYGTDKPGTENATDFWTVKNSWGPFWGEDGYIRIARNMTDGPGQCGITLLASYPVKTHANPPKPPPPAPPPPPGPAPPPGPGPAPYVKCDNIVSCPPKTTCCCQVSMYDQCFAWACCPLVHATCCDDRVHCCPETAPVCDVEGGRCLPKGRSGLLGALTAGVPMVEKIPAIPNDPAGDERVSTIRQV